MTALITKQRFNWMGYNGTETEEFDTTLLRTDGMQANNNAYAHRQQVVLELKERLYRIKRDLELVPEEELRAEEEARARRITEQKRLEEERLRREAEEAAWAEEAERQRLEREKARAEAEEEARRQREAEEQLEEERRLQLGKSEKDSNEDSDEESEPDDGHSEALTALPRTPEEMDKAIKGLVKGIRMLLASTGNGYVSYLDGSLHPSINKLEEYNNTKRESVIKAVDGTNVCVPDPAEHSLTEVSAAMEARDMARKKLDAYYAMQDPTYAARIRSVEKNAYGITKQRLDSDEEEDISTLTEDRQSTKKFFERMRKEYNVKAAVSGKAIAAVLGV
ncbi:hypothetical protein LPMP_191020 [Leishmania panamensis]|uniref:Uncharacterized protein n=1 Tax=Leishmania panamensis TaxID=5679 RepID=A0A088RQB3_LEIPA|nr:hypothetical protein LPMP_191020 [Leishmania panamensis]AIN97444.1 hypothetical protein LPMP_191020 [Leishmania panamensis]